MKSTLISLLNMAEGMFLMNLRHLNMSSDYSTSHAYMPETATLYRDRIPIIFFTFQKFLLKEKAFFFSHNVIFAAYD